MANHQSALKRIRQSEKRRLRNRQNASQLKTSLKAFQQAVEEGSADLESVQRQTISALGRAASKGILHKRAAARKISRISVRVNKLKAASA